MNERYSDARAVLRQHGQEHVLRWWDGLSSNERLQLLTDIESIPWLELEPYLEEAPSIAPHPLTGADVAPVETYPNQPRPGDESLYADARQQGRALIRAGKVGAFTVAGGQGTRLGFDGPKGCMPVTPVGSRSLFQLFAEMILAVQDRDDVAIPWYIMTSPANHQQTVDFFSRHECFGLDPRNIKFFEQRMLPLFDHDGALLLAEKHRLALGPDGHGGAVGALHRSGALADMRTRGLDVISYFQVDNPLVRPFDPLFLGLHQVLDADMSLKASAKAEDHERVGNICVVNGNVSVVEYTDFPAELAALRNHDGTRRFDAANLAIHLIDLGFLEKIVARPSMLPFRRALKAIPFLNESGVRIEPQEPNGIKFELFIFDLLPAAKNVLVLKVDRAEEFSPVKNATGVDSLETSRRDQVCRACRWLEAAGVEVPRNPDGEPNVTIAISPRLALDAEDLIARAVHLPKLRPGDTLLIE